MQLYDGDILLRESNEDWIRLLSEGRFTHAGICSNGESEVAIDAYPGRENRAVASIDVSVFFDGDNAPNGGAVYRYVGAKEKSREAARWAELQTAEEYNFSIVDPIVGVSLELLDDNDLYCSEFVWRCFRQGANVELVTRDSFIDLTAPKSESRNLDILVAYAKAHKGVAGKLIPDSALRKVANVHLQQHGGRFIAPQQLANSHLTRLVVDVEPSSPTEVREEDSKK